MEIVKKYRKNLFFILAIILLNCANNDSESSNFPPSNFEIEVSEILETSAKLIWTASIDPESSIVFYDVYLQGEKLIDNSTELNFDLIDLEEGIVYSGEIVASDPEGNEISVSFNFETSVNQPPTAFIVSVNSRNPFSSRIDWTESTDPEGGDIVYNVYLKEELVAENLNSLYKYFQYLKGLTSYSGYVEAIDPVGKAYKANFSFVTELKVYDDDIRLENQAQVDDFGNSGYNKIDGNLIIGSLYTNLTDVSDLSSLIAIQTVLGDIYIQNTICKNLKGLETINETTSYGKLWIDNNDELLTLEGLEGITKMHEIYIASNKKLLNFNGLDNLKVVTNYFSFPYNESLVSLEGLKNLTTIKRLDIGNNDALKNLKGLEKIKILQELAINSNDNLESLEGLNNLEYCGSISMAENAPLPNLKGFSSLNTISSLYLSGNSKMTSLIGIESLSKVTNYITIQFNENLESLEGLNNFVFSGGSSYGYSLGIYENDKITNLDAFANCRFVDQKGEITIRSNPELVDFCGLTELIKGMDINEVNENTIFRWNKFDPSYEGILNGECSQ